jgi:hypothetical protein
MNFIRTKTLAHKAMPMDAARMPPDLSTHRGRGQRFQDAGVPTEVVILYSIVYKLARLRGSYIPKLYAVQ